MTAEGRAPTLEEVQAHFAAKTDIWSRMATIMLRENADQVTEAARLLRACRCGDAPSPAEGSFEERVRTPADFDERMTAYYYAFYVTGTHAIDLVLSAVAEAGKGAHNTGSWADDGFGESAESAIQRVAQAGADRLRNDAAEADAALATARQALQDEITEREMQEALVAAQAAEIERLRGDFNDAAGVRADDFAAVRAKGGRDWAKSKSPLGQKTAEIAALKERLTERDALREALEWLLNHSDAEIRMGSTLGWIRAKVAGRAGFTWDGAHQRYALAREPDGEPVRYCRDCTVQFADDFRPESGLCDPCSETLVPASEPCGEPNNSFAWTLGLEPRELFVCADCGAGVKADEDGCCAMCGRDCAVETYHAEPPRLSVDPVAAAEEVAEMKTRIFPAASEPCATCSDKGKVLRTGDGPSRLEPCPEGCPEAQDTEDGA